MDADFLDIMEYAKSKGYVMKTTNSLGITTFVELTPNKETLERRLKAYKDDYRKFADEILGIDVKDDVMYGINKIGHHKQVLVWGDRQSGKSTLSILAALAAAIFGGKNVFLTVPNNELRRSIVDRLDEYIKRIPTWIAPLATRRSAEFVFENKGRIVVWVPNSSDLRGTRPDVLIVDEFSHFGKKEQLDFWTAIYPIMSYQNDSRLVVTGTDTVEENLFSCLVIDADRGMNPFVNHRLL